MIKNKETHLLAIDEQNDFCDPKGALFVTGADQDAIRLAGFVTANKRRIDMIHVTLDSHQPIHIAHPIFWRDQSGNHPNPFTLITADDVRNGKFSPTQPDLRQHCLDYVESLEKNSRYVLFLWPPHCLIGTHGAALVPIIADAFNDWAISTFNTINFVPKGSNPFTEHYSAVQADYVIPQDDTTKLNQNLISLLQNDEVGEILITGQALSHCVANTIQDIANNFGEENIKKFTLLEDTTSSVPGFEKLGTDFVTDMKARGMRVATTKNW